MAGSQDKLNRLFDLELISFESSEQAWAALLWALEIKMRSHFETLEDLTPVCQTLGSSCWLFWLCGKKVCWSKQVIVTDLTWFPSTSWKSSSGRKRSQFLQAITETYQSLTIHDKKEIQINGGILIKEYGYQPGQTWERF